MGCALMGHVLFDDIDEVKRYNPKKPYWFNSDSFVLSVDHNCMLQLL